MKKILLLLILPFLFIACSKKDTSSDKIQDIRGTQWRSEDSVAVNGHFGYRDFLFYDSGDDKSGKGSFLIVTKGEAIIFIDDFLWTLTGSELKVELKDQFNEQKTITGSWKLGILYLDGNFNKRR
jgi:hypothetical protein